MLKGIRTKEYIHQENSQEYIVKNNDVTHDSYDDEYYEEMLEDLIEQNIFLDTIMSDNCWVYVDEFDSYTYLRFVFDLNPRVNDLIKKYILIKVGIQNRSSSTVAKCLTAITAFFKDTNFLNEDKIFYIREKIGDWDDSKKRSIHSIQEFLRFSKLDNSKNYIKVLNTISIPDSNTRNLPSYRSIMLFDYIIQDFILNSSHELKMRYYPILIWWELTKIIPLRPIELYTLERSWIYQEKDKYYIHVERRKKERKKIRYERIPALNEIEISKSLYDFISEYIAQANMFNTSKYLFNYEFIRSFIPTKKTYKRNSDYCGGKSFGNVLKHFRKEVITDMYGYCLVAKSDDDFPLNENELEMINIGDTRHIAICSMMLQGINEYTIAQLAGHATLTEQLTYCNHLESYTTAYTYAMAKSFQNRIRLNSHSFGLAVKSKEMIFNRRLEKDNLDEYVKLSNGYCKSKNIPNECDIDDCIFCPYFIDSGNINFDLLEEKNKIIDKEIKTKLDYIKWVVNEGRRVKDNYDLKVNTNSLNSLLKRKALIESYKMNREVLEID